MQAMQAMQVWFSSRLLAAALFTKSASARKGRAIETMSALPEASTSSAISGVLMQLVVINGICTAPFSRLVTQAKAARGTMVARVGVRESEVAVKWSRSPAKSFRPTKTGLF